MSTGQTGDDPGYVDAAGEAGVSLQEGNSAKWVGAAGEAGVSPQDADPAGYDAGAFGDDAGWTGPAGYEAAELDTGALG